MLKISDIVEQAHQTAKSRGWYDPPPSIPERLCLIHSEVTEALEDYRQHPEIARKYGLSLRDVFYQGEDDISLTKSSFEANEKGQDVEVLNKPIGFPSELADIIIRVCDLAGFLGHSATQARGEGMLAGKLKAISDRHISVSLTPSHPIRLRGDFDRAHADRGVLLEALLELEQERGYIQELLDGDGVTSSAKEAAMAANALIQKLLEERTALKRPSGDLTGEQPAPKCESSNLPAVWDLVCEEMRSNLVEFEAMLPEQIDMWEIYGRALTLAIFVGKQAGSTNVLADMRERDAVGRTRYGVPLQPHNGRKPLVDAYQELLDTVVYLRQHIYETEHPATVQPAKTPLDAPDDSREIEREERA